MSDVKIGKLLTGGERRDAIDPYLEESVKPGEWCYLFLYPNTVTSLRHEWTHPAFLDTLSAPARAVLQQPLPEPITPNLNAAKGRVAEIAELVDRSYDRLISDAHAYLDIGEYVTEQGGMSWQDTFPSYAVEFWTLFAVITGREVPVGKREANFFSCSC